MFSLTRKTGYALIALSRLCEEMRDDPHLLSARQIADQYDLPLSLLMNIFKDLNRTEIIQSKRGAGGGYLLNKKPDQITLLQIVEAIEGPVNITKCCHDDETESCETCRIIAKCPTINPMQRFNDKVHEFLSDVTLETLITDNTLIPASSLTIKATT